MSVVIDLQGFKIENNHFIVKEFAAYDGNKLSHFVFKPPFRMDRLPPHLQKQVVWLTENHHAIKWKDGFVPLHKFFDILHYITDKYDRVYVKGKEKAEYVKKLLLSKPVIELDEQPSLQQGEPNCLFHSKMFCMCALTNVFYLYDKFLMKE